MPVSACLSIYFHNSSFFYIFFLLIKSVLVAQAISIPKIPTLAPTIYQVETLRLGDNKNMGGRRRKKTDSVESVQQQQQQKKRTM